MIRIGITGGMGAGKSVISEMMRCLGIPVYDADFASKKILNSNTKVKTQLIELLGEEIFSNGQLNRPLMAERIFKNNELLLKTNAIIHPAVFDDFIAWSEAQNKEVVACETAILFESDMVSYFDSILMVSAPLEIRIERCIKRNKFTREQVLERIAKQMDESKKIELSDFVIVNDNRKALYPQLKNFLKKIYKAKQ
ncbi:MAG: dephospho-CoA kinase [Paludibacteraceae bacterium]|jgi:dephospho-CoA kinase|nr:dephospho-CoA kinase [Paludibacteraceae bacterium]